MLAKAMGKTRIIAETGAGQHGVATATACARYNLKCVVYMGTEDIERQKGKCIQNETFRSGGCRSRFRIKNTQRCS